MSEQTPPHSVEAEMAVLGCCILSERGLMTAMSLLTDADFYRPVHKYLFRTMVRLKASGSVIDMLTLSQAIDSSGKLEQVGGLEYLVQVQEAVPSAHHTEYYSKIVADLSLLRRLDSAGRKIIDIVHEEGTEPVDKLAAAQALMSGCARFGSGDFTSVEDIAEAPPIQGVQTGINGIDSRVSCGGLPKSQMTIFAATKKTGKTSGMVQFAVHACRHNKKVLYCTMADLTKHELWRRFRKSLTGYSDRPSQEIKAGKWDEDIADFRRWSNLWIADPKDLGYAVESLVLKIESRNADVGYDLVVVDYAQNLESPKERDRTRSLVRVSTELSRMAERCGFALLVGSQLSDDGKTYYSQEFENDCGLEIVADRPDLTSNEAFLELKYNRFGPSGSFPVRWDERHLRFSEVLN